MPPFAHQFARLIGPFHGFFPAARRFAPARARRSGRYQGICAIGAAYTKAVTARQCDHTVMPRRQSARLARRAAAFFTPEAKAEGKTKRRNAANGTYI
jgi:hypothetical protein